MCLREWVICMAVRLAGKWLLNDLSHPQTEPSHTKQSIMWWMDANLVNVCNAKLLTKYVMLFLYVDSSDAYVV